MNKKCPVRCSNEGKCFGKGFDGNCTILSTPYEMEGQCPFQKKDRYITNGKYYPYNPLYGKEEEE